MTWYCSKSHSLWEFCRKMYIFFVPCQTAGQKRPDQKTKLTKPPSSFLLLIPHFLSSFKFTTNGEMLYNITVIWVCSVAKQRAIRYMKKRRPSATCVKRENLREMPKGECKRIQNWSLQWDAKSLQQYNLVTHHLSELANQAQREKDGLNLRYQPRSWKLIRSAKSLHALLVTNCTVALCENGLN